MKYVYSVSAVCFSDQFDCFDSFLLNYVSYDEKIKALNIFDDIISLNQKQVTVREFLSAHPEFIYRWGALTSLIDYINKNN